MGRAGRAGCGGAVVIRICVCTHSFIQHQRLPYGEQPCHSNITGPCSPHPFPASPHGCLLGAPWQLCPCLLHPRAPLGLCCAPPAPCTASGPAGGRLELSYHSPTCSSSSDSLHHGRIDSFPFSCTLSLAVKSHLLLHTPASLAVSWTNSTAWCYF